VLHHINKSVLDWLEARTISAPGHRMMSQALYDDYLTGRNALRLIEANRQSVRLRPGADELRAHRDEGRRRPTRADRAQAGRLATIVSKHWPSGAIRAAVPIERRSS